MTVLRHSSHHTNPTQKPSMFDIRHGRWILAGLIVAVGTLVSIAVAIHNVVGMCILSGS